MKSSETTDRHSSVYVYEAPMRIWHWVNGLCMVVLGITGYLIGSPLPTVSGEPVDTFVFGYIRFAHFIAGYLMVIGFVFRFYWAIVGNEHSRQLFFPPFNRREYWQGVWHEVKWYAFIAKQPKKYIGHNPLAMLVMHVVFMWCSLFMIFTGMALYGEGAGMGSWQYEWFSSWLIPLFGQSQDLHTWHHVGLWVLVCFVIMHVYVAIREDIMSRQSLISTMVSGWRMFKDDEKPEDRH